VRLACLLSDPNALLHACLLCPISLTPDLLHKLPKLAEDEDEFDGLTPEEINALVEKKAQEGGA